MAAKVFMCHAKISSARTGEELQLIEKTYLNYIFFIKALVYESMSFKRATQHNC